MTRTQEYELGHSDFELKRLARQAELVDPFTERYFRLAGVGPGMRVLDLGSGGGDTALLVADIVGDGGEVVGVDRSAEAVAAATARVKALGKRNVSFRQAKPEALMTEPPFDALVGRYVLMFNPDPSSMLREAARAVRPGGVVVFHEVDWRPACSAPPAPLFDRSLGWILETFKRVGSNPYMGADLFATFRHAGLPPPTMSLSALMGGAESDVSGLDLIADLTVTMAPAIASHGVASLEEIGLAALKERMVAEAARNGSVVIGRGEVGAWARVPEESATQGVLLSR